MNQEDLLVLLVVFVLGFVVSQMMSGRLVEGSNDNGYELLGRKVSQEFQGRLGSQEYYTVLCVNNNGSLVNDLACDTSKNKLIKTFITDGKITDLTEDAKKLCSNDDLTMGQCALCIENQKNGCCEGECNVENTLFLRSITTDKDSLQDTGTIPSDS